MYLTSRQAHSMLAQYFDCILNNWCVLPASTGKFIRLSLVLNEFRFELAMSANNKQVKTALYSSYNME